ncbi:MAG: polymerase, partial [Spirochaetales bacterium]
MITMDQIQAYMRERIGEDQDRRFVNVSGDSLEDALEQAAIELDLPVKRIEYEVVDRGSRGVLGVGRKPYLILAYPATEKVDETDSTSDLSADISLLPEDEGSKDRDGQSFVRLTAEGVMLKVTKPVGNGDKATDREAVEKLLQRIDEGYDKGRVARIVKLAQEEFIKVGEYSHDPTADASLTVEIGENEMKAYLFAYPPGDGGADPSFNDVVSFL